MGICRLCLQVEGEKIKSQKVLELLKKFIPGMYSIMKNLDLLLCEICSTNIETLSVFMDTINDTNEKIKTAKEATTDKIDLMSLVQMNNNYRRKVSSACRLCLNIISKPQIFLYENKCNLLRHDLILEMSQICMISLDLELSEHPVMCVQCWENLQICYSFIKGCLDMDKKITAYCTIFCVTKKDITENIFTEMCNYFSQNLDEDLLKLSKVIEKEDELFENCLDASRYTLRKNVKREYAIEDCSDNDKVCAKKEVSKSISKRRRHYFTQDDDNFLLEAYMNVNNTENSVRKKIWPQIQIKWLESFPEKPLTISSIHSRVKRLISKTGGIKRPRPKKSIPRPPKKPFVLQNILLMPPINKPDVEFHESFTEDVPSVKLESLSNEEVHLAEFKLEPLSDCPPSDSDSDTESLPIPDLERMDVRESSNNVWIDISKELDEEEEEDSDSGNFHAILKYYKHFLSTTKMYADKTVTTYKCNSCDFETKYQYEADCHKSCNHFECEYCSFETSKLSTLIRHTSQEHKLDIEDDDIPELTPFAI
ncbi:unnamed protein product [Diabrotica balteata]|uniref:ZAD domain-containing protein n=1 Tax=Diabrotica balteata TaxID=107213 RepID=A0A9N9T9E9_DIABA|nr:unnamed protein product [Diabrotica balteata]